MHSELISKATIAAATTAFSAIGFPINPGLASTFPLLAQIAQTYTQYTFRELAAHVVTRVGTNNSGWWAMAPAYNVEEALPTTEEAISTYVGATQAAVYSDFAVDFSPAEMTYGDPKDEKYIRTGVEAGNPQVFDSGKLIYASGEGPGMAPIDGGAIWVHYAVELSGMRSEDVAPLRVTDPVTFLPGTGPPRAGSEAAPLLGMNVDLYGSPGTPAGYFTPNPLRLNTSYMMAGATGDYGIVLLPKGVYQFQAYQSIKATIEPAEVFALGLLPHFARFADFPAAPITFASMSAIYNANTTSRQALATRAYWTSEQAYFDNVGALRLIIPNVLEINGYIETDEPIWFALGILWVSIAVSPLSKYDTEAANLVIKPA